MKALIYYGPKDLRLEECPKPVAGAKDVVVKNVRAGICGSDLTAYLYDGMGVGILQKGQFGHDGQFGHEMTGIVESVGEEVTDVKAGDRVAIIPTVCKRSGMLGCDIAGAFSEYTLVEDAAYGYNLLKLSDDVSFDEAVVVEPFAVGTQAKNCIHVQPHEHVVIWGAGTIGLCALNAVLAVGCVTPVIIDLNEDRLKLAKKMGAVVCCPKPDTNVREFLMQTFGKVVNPFGFENPDVDAYIDCAGGGTVLEQSIHMAKRYARIAVVAVYKKPVTLPVADLLSGEITMTGSCGYQMKDIIEAFQNINEKRTKVPQIVTHHFPHDKSVEAFEFAVDPKAGGVKVVIDYI